MQKPTIHINGSSREDLKRQFYGAYRALGDAIQLMVEATPHGRDYYVQEPGAYEVARSEHIARLRVIRDLQKEYLELFQSTEG